VHSRDYPSDNLPITARRREMASLLEAQGAILIPTSSRSREKGRGIVRLPQGKLDQSIEQ